MPRRARLDYPGCLHHVTARGIERRRLFVDDFDRRCFVRSMERLFPETGVRCLAWALMDNHVHLLVETGDVPLSRVMHRLLQRHAQRFNRRHVRSGRLFQNRFRSDIVRSGPHLLEAVRYVHLNPVRAGMVQSVKSLATYPWTGHAVLMGDRPNRFQDVDGVLALVGTTKASAAAEMRTFLEDGLTDGSPDPARRPTLVVSHRAQEEAGIFGVASLRARDAYVDRVVRKLDSRDLRRAALRRDGWTIDRVIDIVCRRMRADAASVREGRRTPREHRARAVIAYLSCERLGTKQTDVARRTGVRQSSVSRALGRGRAMAATLRGLPI
jgi:putative transposase